nr:glycosyltransferase [Amycolatopsis anabasis]
MSTRVTERGLRLLVWHVHGSWTTSFVQGPHTYLLPTVPGRGPDGRGRAGRAWPERAHEVAPGDLPGAGVDAVILQRPEELELAQRWLGRRPGSEIPAIYVEHNTPRGNVPDTRHFLAGREDIPVVHVTHFNSLMWDTGIAPTRVIEHGVVDPGRLYTGESRSAAVMINEPVRRWRVTGTDLLPAFAEVAPLQVYGMGLDGLTSALGADPARIRPVGDLSQPELHRAVARNRVYVHTARWTSLGLSLIEAMHLGMPVVAVASTEASRAVPREAGFVSADITELTTALGELLDHPDLAHRMGSFGREFALAHYGIEAFVRRWDELLLRAVPETAGTAARGGSR